MDRNQGGGSPLTFLRDNGCLFCRGRRNVTCVPDVNTSTTLGRLPHPGLPSSARRMRYRRGLVRAGALLHQQGDKLSAACAHVCIVLSTTARSSGSASVLWGLAHLPGRADPPHLLPTLWDGKQERLATLTERAPVRLPLPFRSIHYALMRL